MIRPKEGSKSQAIPAQKREMSKMESLRHFCREYSSFSILPFDPAAAKF